ncbi:hypothetical protein IF188_10190 [Microbacterium sp. NEAU-LLC]|uniref:Uncharacterized protein n=1 Tax=Microbacterium helvum TaxID=2773713 RepID=A0ABR8NN25_9MICO|nr:hypothetical protein [Microbacterium helvum]MBD3942065.1 hypothetical protein [Microbacterium helvum]
MIAYQLDYDAKVWLPVPDGADESWGDDVVAHYAEGLGGMSPELDAALRRVALTAAALRTDLTGQLLLFCPPALAPVIGVAGIQVLEDTATDLDEAVAADVTAVLLPNVETLEDAYWGEGRRAAVVTASAEPGIEGGRFNYAFRRGDTLLVATAIADRIPYATSMLAYSDKLVTSVRLEEA